MLLHRLCGDLLQHTNTPAAAQVVPCWDLQGPGSRLPTSVAGQAGWPIHLEHSLAKPTTTAATQHRRTMRPLLNPKQASHPSKCLLLSSDDQPPHQPSHKSASKNTSSRATSKRHNMCHIVTRAHLILVTSSRCSRLRPADSSPAPVCMLTVCSCMVPRVLRCAAQASPATHNHHNTMRYVEIWYILHILHLMKPCVCTSLEPANRRHVLHTCTMALNFLFVSVS